MESLRISQRRRCLERKPPTRTQQVVDTTHIGSNIGIIGSHQVSTPLFEPLTNNPYNDSYAMQPIDISGSSPTFNITFPNNKPLYNEYHGEYYCGIYVYGRTIIWSLVLPAIEDAFPSRWYVGNNINNFATGLGKVSEGVYQFNSSAFGESVTYTYTPGQTLTIYLADGLQKLSLDGVELATASITLYTNEGYNFYLDLQYSDGPETGPVTWISTFTTENINIVPTTPIQFETINNNPGTDNLPIIFGGPSSYTIEFTGNGPQLGGSPYYYEIDAPDISGNTVIIVSYVLPAIENTYPTSWEIGTYGPTIGRGFGMESDGIYKFNTYYGFFDNIEYNYTAGQTLTVIITNGLQILKLDDIELARGYNSYNTTDPRWFYIYTEQQGTQTTPIIWNWSFSEGRIDQLYEYTTVDDYGPISDYVTQFVGNFGTCIQKSPNKPMISESMRMASDLCSTAGNANRTSNGNRFYTTVGTVSPSVKLQQLKDTITAAAPRFSEFITPRPPPNYYFYGSTIQVSMAGEPIAPNSVCSAGEIKRVG